MSEPIPKPAKRGRKPRKPLPRVHAGGKRKRTVRRIRKVKASRKSCLALWSQFIRRRDGKCWMLGKSLPDRVHYQCGGPLQAAHGFPKGTYRAVMFEPWNGFALCRDVHQFFHHREASWHALLRALWGAELYDERWRQASKTGVKHDFAAIETELYRQIGLLG